MKTCASNEPQRSEIAFLEELIDFDELGV